MARFVAGSSLFAILVLFAFVPSQIAAQSDPAAGILPFSTHVSGLVDSVDLATSSILIKISVRSKAGAIPFNYAIVSNSHVYVYTVNPPNESTQELIQVSGVGTGDQSGFQGQQPMGAHMRSAWFAKIQCDSWSENDNVYSWSLVDSTGASHPTYAQTDDLGCKPLPQGVTPTDGSGYTINFTSEFTANIYDKAGNQVGSNVSDPTISDPDGNQIVWSAGNANDTLVPSGTPYALSVASWYLGNSTPPSPDTYQYTDANGNPQTVQVNYSSYTVKTNFGCPGEIDLSGASEYLPSSIDVPGSGTYLIQYEETFPGNNQYFTGRIAQITLPSGGYVSYTYGGSNNGFNCSISAPVT